MKYLLTLALVATAAAAASADITVKTPATFEGQDFTVKSSYIDDMVKPRMQRPAPESNDYTVKNGEFKIKSMPAGAARYIIPVGPVGDQQSITVYAMPKEDITLTIKSTEPLDYAVSGSKLMEDIAALDRSAAVIEGQAQAMLQSGVADEESMQTLENEYIKIFTDYITANPGAEAVPYALLHLEDQLYLDTYESLLPQLEGNMFLPLLEQQKEYALRKIAAEKRKLELQSGDMMAPDFTFKTVDGKSVSLSDFRGKWVIIDFWGSWCPWCIKGFPKLKEAYAQYSPELEILGVACNDKRAAWEKALVKYDLPWVNVYNPEEGGGKLLVDYAVEGFPTKAIISPDGKIKNITTGEDPAFFEILANLLKK